MSVTRVSMDVDRGGLTLALECPFANRFHFCGAWCPLFDDAKVRLFGQSAPGLFTIARDAKTLYALIPICHGRTAIAQVADAETAAELNLTRQFEIVQGITDGSKVVCPKCGGRGEINTDEHHTVCPTCRGVGVINAVDAAVNAAGGEA